MTIERLLQGSAPAHDPSVDRRHDEGACPAALVLVVSGQQLVCVDPLPAMHHKSSSCQETKNKRFVSNKRPLSICCLGCVAPKLCLKHVSMQPCNQASKDCMFAYATRSGDIVQWLACLQVRPQLQWERVVGA